MESLTRIRNFIGMPKKEGEYSDACAAYRKGNSVRPLQTSTSNVRLIVDRLKVAERLRELRLLQKGSVLANVLCHAEEHYHTKT